MDCHFRDLPDFQSSRHDDKLMANPKNDSRYKKIKKLLIK